MRQRGASGLDIICASPHPNQIITAVLLSQLSPRPAMATVTNFLGKPPRNPPFISKQSSLTPNILNLSFIPKHNNFTSEGLGFEGGPRHLLSTARASTSAPSGGAVKKPLDDRVQRVHSIEEFDEALSSAKNRLVVVEFAARDSEQSSKIYPFMVELSRTCNDVVFLLVMGDESEKTKELCRREKVDQVPHFSFYKNMEKIHEEEAIGPDQLVGDVLYYGDNHSAVVQLHCRDDLEQLIEEHRVTRKLIVLDVGLKHCGPCVKVYPTVVKLSRQMTDTVVFARMNGDENDSCMRYLKEMDVVEVPTFLFIRDGLVQGRYVGSGKGELVGEILRYQGVRVTY